MKKLMLMVAAAILSVVLSLHADSNGRSPVSPDNHPIGTAVSAQWPKIDSVQVTFFVSDGRFSKIPDSDSVIGTDGRALTVLRDVGAKIGAVFPFWPYCPERRSKG